MNAVRLFCALLWEMRERTGGMIDDSLRLLWGRLLAFAVWAKLLVDEGYDPEVDRQVLWAREVLAAAWRGFPGCLASAELEATVAFQLGRREALVEPCGKDRAAGGDE